MVSQTLAQLIGVGEETRAKIVSALWQYIKSNRLQDPDDRKSIHLNTALKSVFGAQIDRFEFYQLINLLKPHL